MTVRHDSSKPFNHPYMPYDIQVDFMENLYNALDHYKVGIFESPTGTGKTLSLICASMTWLRDYKRKSLEGLDAGTGNMETSSTEPDWVTSHTRDQSKKEYEARLREFEDQLRRIREITRREKSAVLAGDALRSNKRAKHGVLGPTEKAAGSVVDTDNAFLLIEETSNGHVRPDPVEEHKYGINPDVQGLLEKLSKSHADLTNDPDMSAIENPVKIFFSSRTHSQLSQLVGQLKLTQFPPSISTEEDLSESIKMIALGSRKQLCIHPKVSKLSSVSQMNDACLDLQNSADHKCEFLKSEHNIDSRVMLKEFQTKALSDVHDIEDIAALGKKSGVCPYYATRGSAIKQSEIVTLPYQLLLQKSARESLSIDIKDSIVIIDEAHNILETISAINSLSINLREVSRALKGLLIYQEKFRSRLSFSNRNYLGQTVKVVRSLESFILRSTELPAQQTAPGVQVKAEALFKDSTSDTVNTYKLEKFLQTSKLAFKVDSYLEQEEKKEKEQEQTKASAAAHSNEPRLVLSKIIQFLCAVTNPSSEGKIFYGRSQDGELILQYLLLDPSEQFREIVEQARCVILAGGTMEPTEDYTNFLFPYVAKSQVKLFSCGHVIPKANLAVIPVDTGFNQKFNFTFATRDSSSLHESLGASLIELLHTIPKGVVVFFPSYKYLDILTKWKSTGIYQKMESIKPIFQESQSQGKSAENVLLAYDEAIAKNDGAVLFAVVGGKMSEGINFSDERARAVIMVGLPFPNMYSAEMSAKRKFIEQSIIESGGSKEEALLGARNFYENTCMRAVNQSIGRSIRHANDYSVVILLDQRYGAQRIQKKLPKWIRQGMESEYGSRTGLDVHQCSIKVQRFFRERQNNSCKR